MRSVERYDVVVAGGGLAGVAAAISAASVGARTLLIERYGFLGGMGTAGLVNPFMSYSTSTGKPLVGGVFTNLCDRMSELGGMLDRAFDPEVMKFAAQEMVLESGAQLLFHSWITGAVVDHKKRLVGLEVLTKSGSEKISAKCVVDATGDADIAAMAGVPFEMGSPDSGFTQAMTLMFSIGGVDLRKALLYAKDHHDQMRFPQPQNEADVDRMLQGVISLAGFYDLVEAARLKGEFSLPQDMVFFISLPNPGQVVVNTTHIGGLDGTDSRDLTRAEIEGRKQVFQLMSFFRKYVPGFESAYLLQTGTQVGIRETRRVYGEYLFTAQDVVEGRKFPDAVLRSAYPIDIHAPIGKGYTREEDLSVPNVPPPGDWYEVPYRCLVPREIENLLVAGRCISATHEGQAAVRIMPNCMALGQAAGAAAALSVRGKILPRKLDMGLLRKTLLEQRAAI